jgi:Dna[CI] antecedent, DciA
MHDLLERAPAKDIPVLAWPIVCGEKVANRTRALNFSGGILYVQVPDKDWKTQLMDLARQYVAALNTFKCEPVQRIEFLLPGDNIPA